MAELADALDSGAKTCISANALPSIQSLTSQRISLGRRLCSLAQIEGNWSRISHGEHLHRHKLRKTCASNWEAKGVPVRTIQFMLGHKSLETTMRYLGITSLDLLTDKIDAAAVIV
jgi:integrase